MAKLYTANLSRLVITGCALLPLALGCEDCSQENFAPQGSIQPAILDLGPVLDGESCEAEVRIFNNGGSELQIIGAELIDLSGDYSFNQVVDSVGIGGDEPLRINYTASGTDNIRQSVTVVLATNDPDDDGEVTGTITAIATDQAGAIAALECPNEAGDAFMDCGADLRFGAVNIQDAIIPIDQRAGLTLEVQVVNNGNAEMQLLAALMNEGNPDFTVSGIQQGNVLVDLPITLEAGAGACGVVNPDAANSALITLFYSPTALGADADTLLILTDALEGDEIQLPLTGIGSDIGILLTPPTVSFGDTAEGETANFTVTVSNLGTNPAPVNSTCVDLDGDETCDFDCTGGDPGLDGTLNCEIYRSDDTRDGKGYILEPTDAVAGGDDEREVRLTWSPIAGTAVIPATAMLRFETGILNDKVWTARIIGGAAGNLVIDGLGAECASGLCVPAMGDPTDVTGWTGTFDFELSNDGAATLSVNSFAWEGPPTIADDYTLGMGGNPVTMEAPGIELAPGASVTLTVDYANNDASGADAINLVINHTGVNLLNTIPITVTPPPGT